MSVEEIRERILSWQFGTDPARVCVRDYLIPDLDRLILEVRAAMPCSGRSAIWCNDGTAELSEPCGEQTIWDTDFHDAPLPPGKYCPSCAAAAKLKGLTDVVVA